MTFIPQDSVSRNGTHNRYRDIGIKDGNVLLMAMDYGVSPATGKGCVVVRFLRRKESGTPDVPLTVLSDRGASGDYNFVSPEGIGDKFTASRLNKTVVEVFAKETSPKSAVSAGAAILKLGADEALAEWLTTILDAEGFNYGTLPTLVTTIRTLLGIEITEPPVLDIVFPDLTKEASVNKGKAEAMTAVNKYKDDDADEESDDNDEDEDYLVN